MTLKKPRAGVRSSPMLRRQGSGGPGDPDIPTVNKTHPLVTPVDQGQRALQRNYSDHHGSGLDVSDRGGYRWKLRAGLAVCFNPARRRQGARE